MERYILINLNQTVNRAQLMEMRRERWRWVGFAIMVLVFGFLGYTIHSINQEMDQLIRDRENRIEDVNFQIASLKENAEVDLSKEDVISLYNMENKRIIWTRILKAIAEITPEDMAVTQLAYDESRGKGKLVISGISHTFSDEKEFAIIDKFIKRLENNPDFSTSFKFVRFVSSDHHKTRGQEIVQFKIEAREHKPERRRSRKELKAEMEAKKS